MPISPQGHTMLRPPSWIGIWLGLQSICLLIGILLQAEAVRSHLSNLLNEVVDLLPPSFPALSHHILQHLQSFLAASTPSRAADESEWYLYINGKPPQPVPDTATGDRIVNIVLLALNLEYLWQSRQRHHPTREGRSSVQDADCEDDGGTFVDSEAVLAGYTSGIISLVVGGMKLVEVYEDLRKSGQANSWLGWYSMASEPQVFLQVLPTLIASLLSFRIISTLSSPITHALSSTPSTLQQQLFSPIRRSTNNNPHSIKSQPEPHRKRHSGWSMTSMDGFMEGRSQGRRSGRVTEGVASGSCIASDEGEALNDLAGGAADGAETRTPVKRKRGRPRKIPFQSTSPPECSTTFTPPRTPIRYEPVVEIPTHPPRSQRPLAARVKARRESLHTPQNRSATAATVSPTSARGSTGSTGLTPRPRPKYDFKPMSLFSSASALPPVEHFDEQDEDVDTEGEEDDEGEANEEEVQGLNWQKKGKWRADDSEEERGEGELTRDSDIDPDIEAVGSTEGSESGSEEQVEHVYRREDDGDYKATRSAALAVGPSAHRLRDRTAGPTASSDQPTRRRLRSSSSQAGPLLKSDHHQQESEEEGGDDIVFPGQTTIKQSSLPKRDLKSAGTPAVTRAKRAVKRPRGRPREYPRPDE